MHLYYQSKNVPIKSCSLDQFIKMKAVYSLYLELITESEIRELVTSLKSAEHGYDNLRNSISKFPLSFVCTPLTSLKWRHNGCDGASNHQPHHCLFNRLFRRSSKKHPSSTSLAFVWGIRRGPVNSPHKWPVMRKRFLFDDVIIIYIIYKKAFSLVNWQLPMYYRYLNAMTQNYLTIIDQHLSYAICQRSLRESCTIGSEFSSRIHFVSFNQFGFRKPRSTYMALVPLMVNLIILLYKDEYVSSIFLDFSKDLAQLMMLYYCKVYLAMCSCTITICIITQGHLSAYAIS